MKYSNNMWYTSKNSIASYDMNGIVLIIYNFMDYLCPKHAGYQMKYMIIEGSSFPANLTLSLQ